MRSHIWRGSVFALAGILTLFAFTPSVAGQDKPTVEAKYKFHKGDVLKYDVTSHLAITMRGTHPSFLQNGNDAPLAWTVNGVFENAVLEVNEGDGAATLERRIRQISSSGHVNDDKFKFAWDREKDKTVPDAQKMAGLMDRFIAEMIATPVKYGVDAEGKTSMQFTEMGRLVMRRGMMFWPIRSNEMSWTTDEEIAVPVLHDKIKLEFKNTVAQDTTKTGFKARIIRAPASLKSADRTPGFGFDNLTFTVSGQATAEFDLTNGRLHKLDLDLKIEFKGEAPVGDGRGDIKGVATYKESQVYKD